jgi:hypothetical protein
MKPLFSIQTIVSVLFLIALSACVQPFSGKAFYKNNNASGEPPSDANESAQSLTIEDISSMLNTPGLNEWNLARSLQKMNKNWRIKGADIKTGEKFYINFYSRDNQEALVWHTRENIAEYVTNNTNHYNSILNNLKSTGYKAIGSSTQNGETFINGRHTVTVSQAQLYNNSMAYKIILGNKN